MKIDYMFHTLMLVLFGMSLYGIFIDNNFLWLFPIFLMLVLGAIGICVELNQFNTRNKEKEK